MPLPTSPYEQLSKESTGAPWPWKMFSFTAFIVAAVVVIYFGLAFGYGPYLRHHIDGLNTELADLSSQIPTADQDNFISFYSQLVNVQSILSHHVSASGLFPILERNTHARVYFTTFDLSVTDRRLSLEGVASSYQTLSEQLDAFSKVPEITKYLVSESQLVDGRVRFRVLLFFTPAVFGNISEPRTSTN